MLDKGTQVGNYVVEAEIGGGGMARLYRVRHAVLGTLHAMKVLSDSFRERPEVRQRFLAEGMIAARLAHPNVVRVTDTVSTPEVAALIMELVQGPNLEEYLRGLRTPPSPTEIRAIFVPVLDAVAEAHRRGVIHRDIKPANILLAAGPSGFVPKVTDFGIAKITDAASALMQKKGATHADARMGTLSYMSPEQIRGAREVTTRSDIFSLGATLYELATCHVAFDGESDYDIMHKIVQGEHPPPELVPGVDKGVAYAIRRALRPEPEQRFAACEEMSAALAGPIAPAATAVASAATLPAAAVAAPVAHLLDPPPSPSLARREAVSLSTREELELRRMRPAPREERLKALLVDGAVLGGALGMATAVPLLGVPLFVAVLGYQWFLMAKAGQSIGKKRFHLKVVLQDGSPAGFVNGVLIRFWVLAAIFAVPYFGQAVAVLDFLSFFVAKDQKCIHDHLASTRVVMEAPADLD